MFVSKNIVYLELHKTGCTHIRSVLKELIDGKLISKHNQASSSLFGKGRKFLGSVRDPWEWYTSLWAYGCDHRGSVYGHLTKKVVKMRWPVWKQDPYSALLEFLTRLARDNGKWQDTYKDVNDAEAFRTWLFRIHDQKYLHHIGEGFGSHSLSQFSGLLTYRYLKLFCTKAEEATKLYGLSTFDQLLDYDNKCCFIDRIIRNENLEIDLVNALEDFGVELSSQTKAELLTRPKTNASSRKHGPGYYYDNESEQLVAQREKLIVGKFGYIAPSMRG